MPLYEYFCTSCQRTFETLRPAQEADNPVSCPACQHASSQRILSLFASSVKTNGATSPLSMDSSMGSAMSGGMSDGMSGGMGGGCCGGACGCHN